MAVAVSRVRVTVLFVAFDVWLSWRLVGMAGEVVEVIVMVSRVECRGSTI